MQNKIAQLHLAPTQKSNSVGEIFVAQPDLNKEELLGRLFIILESRQPIAGSDRFINFLFNELNKNYYTNDKAIMRERVKSITIEQVFESCLAKTNKAIYDQLHSRKLNVDFNQLDITVGVIHQTEVHFTILGKNRVFLIFKNKKSPQEQYQSRELTSQLSAESSREVNPSKIFSNLMNGAIPVSGFLFFTNEALPEYVGSRQLIEIISTLPPLSAIEQIKNKLEQLNSFISFFGLLIKNTVGQPIAEPARPRANTEAHKSIRNLRTTEAQTERLLTPTGLIDFRHWWSSGKKAFAFSRSKSSDLVMASKNIVREKLPSKKRSGRRMLAKTIGFIMQAGTAAIAIALSLYENARFRLRPDQLREQPQILARSIGRISLKPWHWFGALSKKNQALMLAGLACLILFGGNVYLITYRNAQAATTKNYADKLLLIEQLENQIEANLIPKNYEGAKSLAQQARAALASLPPLKQADPKTEELKSKFAALEKRIRKETEAETILIGALTDHNAAAQPQNLTLYKDKLFLADSANKSIYRIDLPSKAINAYNASLEDTKNLSSTAREGNLLYFWDNDNVFAYNLDKLEGKHYQVKSFAEQPNVTALSVYDVGGITYAYLVAPANKQIFRVTYSNASGQFINPRAWLQAEANLDNLKQFYLDGNAYLLFNDGRLEKYTRGDKQNWNPIAVEPKIDLASAIATSEKFVYVADPANKRIVVLSNSGSFHKQLKNELLTNVTAMAVDESKNILYVLNGTSVYSVALQDS